MVRSLFSIQVNSKRHCAMGIISFFNSFFTYVYYYTM